MSTLKVNNLQVGQDGTAANNYTLYQPASPDGTVRLGYGVAGSVTDILTLKNSRLGIGTVNPGTKLDVRGGNWSNGDIVVGQTGNAGRINFRRGADGSDAAYFGYDGASNNSQVALAVNSGDGTILLKTNSLERLRISSTGQIGMGKSGAVTVNGNSPLTIQESDSNSETICLRATNSGGNGSQPGIVMKTAAGGHIGGIYCDVNSDYMRLSTSGTDRVYISDTGNVGVGVASPSQKFMVKGIIASEASNSTNNWMAYTYTDNTFRLNYNGAGADEVTMTSDGMVGIGNTNPLSGLDIVQSDSRTRITKYGHLITQNTGYNTTNYWSLAARTSGEFDIGYGVPDTNGTVNGNFLRIAVNGDIRTYQNLLIPYDKKIHLEGSSGDDLNAIWKAETENTLFLTSRYNIANIIDSNNDDTAGFWSVRTNGTTLSGSTELIRVEGDGRCLPGADATMDLGSATKRWANIYSADLQLSNEGAANDVDGTWGQYTIQEGEDDLFLINRRSGKKYKFMLQEVN